MKVKFNSSEVTANYEQQQAQMSESDQLLFNPCEDELN